MYYIKNGANILVGCMVLGRPAPIDVTVKSVISDTA